MTSQVLVTLCLAMWCMAFTPGGADDTCSWEERTGVALSQLQAPAVVLREYSDVTSSRDCYQKCCDLKSEGCNVAVYLSYDTEVVCMNVKCVPFDNCIWGPYAASIAAVNDQATSLASVTLGGVPNTTTSTPSSSGVNGSGDAQVNTTGLYLTTNVPANANDTTTTAAPANSNAAGNLATSPATNNINNNNNNNNNDLNFDKHHPWGGDNNNGKVDENGLASESNGNNGGSDSNFQDGGAGNRTSSVYMGGSQRSHVNYTVSITIGVLTCVAFLLIMYVAAKKFHLFQDRSKYSRLLENPEQLNEPLIMTPEA